MNRREMLTRAGAGVAAVGLAGIAPQALAHTAGTSALYASWIHGTSFQAEDQNAINGIIRFGWGAVFRGKPGSFTWFHVAVPTPVITDNIRIALEKIFIFYKTTHAVIKSVHVYDGPTKFRSFDNLSLSGDRSTGIVAQNTWTITPNVEMKWGLGFSVGVQFSVGIDSPITPELLFTTAGADFRVKR